MSHIDADPDESMAGGPGPGASHPVSELLAGHSVALGGPRGFEVTRTLPNRGLRMVGAWCFADSYGPHDVSAGPGMRVPAHPHIGLQTVSWLVSGEVMHRDSVGSSQLIQPGQLNLMTAGHGISHSEVTPAEHSQWLHGVQLWVALPSSDVSVAPSFEHHASLPVFTAPGLIATVLIGTLGSATSPARAYSPLVGADVAVSAGAVTSLSLRPDFEYAMLAMSGTATVDDAELASGPLLYLGSGRSDLPVSSSSGARLLLLGGEPFEEELVMWWNFVGRSHEDIVAAREQWMNRPQWTPGPGPRFSGCGPSRTGGRWICSGSPGGRGPGSGGAGGAAVRRRPRSRRRSDAGPSHARHPPQAPRPQTLTVVPAQHTPNPAHAHPAHRLGTPQHA